jgi:hypothetical protein
MHPWGCGVPLVLPFERQVVVSARMPVPLTSLFCARWKGKIV